MDVPDLLQSLNVDPADLEPAPPAAPLRSSGTRRLEERHPCLRCGRPATVASVIDVPGRGRCWIDRCTACLVATVDRGGPPVPLTETLAVLRDASREAGVRLTVVVGDSCEDGRRG